MHLLPARLTLRQQLLEHGEQLPAGGQLALAEHDELLRGDLSTGLHLGQV
jgi:hypothetical protein